jgi:xylose isomerase
MVGTVNLWKTIEVMYYLKKYNFKGAVYFDTFPKREGAVAECEANIKMCRLIETMIDNYGIENIDKVVLKQDGAAAANLMVELIAAANA